MVRLLLEAGADPTLTNEMGTSAMEVAAYHRHTDCVMLLQVGGSDVNLSVFLGGFDLEVGE